MLKSGFRIAIFPDTGFRVTKYMSENIKFIKLVLHESSNSNVVVNALHNKCPRLDTHSKHTYHFHLIGPLVSVRIVEFDVDTCVLGCSSSGLEGVTKNSRVPPGYSSPLLRGILSSPVQTVSKKSV